MVCDWITRGGNTVEAALAQEMIFYPTHWIYLAGVIVVVRCALRAGKTTRKWTERTAQHSRALTGLECGWDAVAREPEKCGW